MKTFTILTIFILFTHHGYSGWEKCSNLPDNSQSITFFFKEYNDALYLGARTGLYYSNNNGDSWNLLWFKNRFVYDIEFVDDKFIVATELGIFTSSDNGKNWTLKMNGINDTIAQPCKNIYNCDNFILVTKKDRTSDMKFANYLYISTNYGDNWDEVGSEIRDLHILDFYMYDCNIYAVTYKKIYISRNRGKTWDVYLDPFTEYDSFTKITMYKNDIYIIDANNRIYISNDKGKTWNFREILHYGSIYEISNNDSVVFISSYSKGVYFSTNKGDNWVGPSRINNASEYSHNYIGKEYIFVNAMWDGIYRIKISDLTSLASLTYHEPEYTFTIHPNPATEYIEIAVAINPTVNHRVDEGSEIKIMNMLGECVITTPSLRDTPSEKGNLRIVVSHLPTGVYYIRIGNQTQMFVKM